MSVNKNGWLCALAALAAATGFAAEPIWWSFGDSMHQGTIRDDGDAPKGKLLSDNLHWYLSSTGREFF